MRNTGMNKLQYLLYAMLVFALTGCGASTLGNLASNNGTPGAASLKMVYVQSKGAARQLASAPAAVTSVKVTVTGTGTNGSAIPVVNGSISTGTNQGTITGIYAGLVTLSVQAVDVNNNVLYEGFAIAVPITAGVTTTLANPIVMSPPLVKAQDVSCIQCHQTNLDSSGQNLVADFKQSQHYTNSSWNQFLLYTNYSTYGTGAVTGVGCAACHGPKHDDLDPSASGRCFTCHGPTLDANHTTPVTGFLANGNNVCSKCHQSHNATGDCLSCHSVGQNANATGTNVNTYVNDNNGVRAAVLEFSKNSHHVVGKTLTAADCAVCHLEGTAAGVVNPTYHMANATIHLRNCNTTLGQTPDLSTSALGTSEYVWDPANPNHTAMDQFCMSCHNALGATSAVGIVAGNSATNPFNDAISNGYDQMARSVVTPVFNQFDTGNSTHHAVRGQKYSGRTRTGVTIALASADPVNAPAGRTGKAVSNPGAFTLYSGAAVNPTNANPNKNANAGIGPLSPGSRYTLYEAGFFVSNYTPLGATATVGDDSTLHCGDCHTVGQWKPNSTTANTANLDGTTTQVAGLVAIGAHGSVNEYLLRTSDGTDSLHHQNPTDGTSITAQNQGGTYVCYLCHRQGVYGSEEQYLRYAANPAAYPAGYASNPKLGGHGGTHPCNAPGEGESVGMTGSARIWHTTSVVGDGGGGGNLFGYTCANCHNAGNKGFGGIHGNNAVWGTYSATGGYASATSTGVAVTYRNSYRFMGGLSLRYNGGGSAAKWESQSLQASNREGCYNFSVGPAGVNASNQWRVGNSTLAGTTEFTDGANANQTFGTWGGCGQHNGSTTVGSGEASLRKVQRPLQY